MTAVALYVLLSIRGFRAPAPLVAGTVGCGPSSTPSQSSRSERCPQGVIAVGDDTVAPGMLPAGARPGSNIRVNGRKRPNIPRARAAAAVRAGCGTESVWAGGQASARRRTARWEIGRAHV